MSSPLPFPVKPAHATLPPARRHHVGAKQRHLLVGSGPQILGQRTDHAYAKDCACTTCDAVRAKATEIRAKAVDALMTPLVPEGSLLNSKTNRVYRCAVPGTQGWIGTLERATPKVRGKAARKAEKRARRRAQEPRHAELQ